MGYEKNWVQFLAPLNWNKGQSIAFTMPASNPPLSFNPKPPLPSYREINPGSSAKCSGEAYLLVDAIHSEVFFVLYFGFQCMQTLDLVLRSRE